MGNFLSLLLCFVFIMVCNITVMLLSFLVLILSLFALFSIIYLEIPSADFGDKFHMMIIVGGTILSDVCLIILASLISICIATQVLIGVMVVAIIDANRLILVSGIRFGGAMISDAVMEDPDSK